VGQTLGQVLATREDHDRRRLLSAFERLCQAMAYIHAQGYSHGGLSADKVITGSFGEVQITDFSRAKAGEGFGEDVKALGEILDRILGTEAGDEELRDLARRSRSETDRPATAEEVASAVAGYLAAARERAHRLNLMAIEERAEAERARARAEEARLAAEAQRKKHRQFVALAAAVLLLVVAAGGGSWWVMEGRRDREERAREAVESALREAEKHRGASNYREAAEAAKRARDLAADELVTRELRAQAEAAARELAEKDRAERESAERAKIEAAQRWREEEERIRAALDPYPGEAPDRAAIEQAVWDDPGNLWAHLDAARRGLHDTPVDLKWASRYLTAAVALRPESPLLWRHLGDVMGKLGDEEEATASYDRARELEGR
jgi:hypothetical protein